MEVWQTVKLDLHRQNVSADRVSNDRSGRGLKDIEITGQKDIYNTNTNDPDREQGMNTFDSSHIHLFLGLKGTVL